MKMPTVSGSDFDREKIAKIIDDIGQYERELESWHIDRKKMDNSQTFYAVSLILFSITNRYIDLGNEVVSAKKLGVPSTYKDIFFILHRKGMINATVKEAFFRAIECRNSIAHQYYDMTRDRVFDSVLELPVMKGLLRKVEAMIK